MMTTTTSGQRPARTFGIRAAALAGLLVMTGAEAGAATAVDATDTDTILVAEPDEPNPSTCCAPGV
jgi:hypothetical protein